MYPWRIQATDFRTNNEVPVVKTYSTHSPLSSLAAQTRMSTQAAFVCTFSLNLLITDRSLEVTKMFGNLDFFFQELVAVLRIRMFFWASPGSGSFHQQAKTEVGKTLISIIL
jgi:hypothetical protein